jgi:hypothetical protein
MRRAATVAVLAAACTTSACGSKAPVPSAPAPQSTPTAAATATAIAVAPQDQQACALLFTRLRRVTLALSSSSSLVAQSVDAKDLSGRIATEQQQLERSARLMAAGVVPDSLVATNQRLVAALRTFARDFDDAKAPARSGDLAGAVQAMTDQNAVDRILAAAKTIENACGA